jgi:carbon monoxide dehydrogenase subunit G
MTTTTVVVESVSTITNTSSETNTVVQTTETPTVVVGGIMGPPGPASNISSSSDVDITGLQDGSALIWSAASNRWQATTLLEKQVINAGFF